MSSAPATDALAHRLPVAWWRWLVAAAAVVVSQALSVYAAVMTTVLAFDSIVPVTGTVAVGAVWFAVAALGPMGARAVLCRRAWSAWVLVAPLVSAAVFVTVVAWSWYWAPSA